MAKKEKKDTGLSDKELVKKYSDMVPPDFNEAVRNMLREPSPTAPYKADKTHIKKVSVKKAK